MDRTEYEKQHCACPKCNGTSFQTTCLGWFGLDDPNTYCCDKCGWNGKRYQMEPLRVTQLPDPWAGTRISASGVYIGDIYLDDHRSPGVSG